MQGPKQKEKRMTRSGKYKLGIQRKGDGGSTGLQSSCGSGAYRKGEKREGKVKVSSAHS